MSDYRHMPSAVKLSWTLPPGMYIGAIHMRAHVSLAAFEIYLCYSAEEDIDGRQSLIAGSVVALNNDFEAALTDGIARLETLVSQVREDRRSFFRNPPAIPRGIKPDTAPVSLAGIDTSTLSFDL